MCDGDVSGPAVHVALLHERWDLVEACAQLLNTQWQRSMGARLHSLRQSSTNYPVCLLLLEGERHAPEEKLIGHARVSRVLGSRSLFVESVVVHRELRGRGYGRILMEGVERYARARGCKRLCLTTHDKQHFYAHLGFVPSRPVQNVGTLASFMPLEQLHKFCRPNESETARGGTVAVRHTSPPMTADAPLPVPPMTAGPPLPAPAVLPTPPPPPPLLPLTSFAPLPSVSSLFPSSPLPPPPLPPPLSSLPSVPPPAPPAPPSLWTPVDQTLEHTPYTDGRGLPIFWMHKDI
ncbi:N-alpha-acetyltransferase 80 isoform X2 [Brachyhypopomus gauderio]|uniref:N-alpha-acetyltransferase 80 isoform X2 n=1 Tax=Brachyhypopomus gauderio TaxID=698409 RepID=UPI004042247F